MLWCKSQGWDAVLIIFHFHSSAGKNISGPFEEIINNVDHCSRSLFGEYCHRSRGRWSAFRTVPCNWTLWNDIPWSFNIGKTEIQQLNASPSGRQTQSTAPSYVLGVSWNQRRLQIHPYCGFSRGICRWNSGKFSLIENHICKQKHEKRTKHSHCQSCFGWSNPHCHRHSHQRIQGELIT